MRVETFRFPPDDGRPTRLRRASCMFGRHSAAALGNLSNPSNPPRPFLPSSGGERYLRPFLPSPRSTAIWLRPDVHDVGHFGGLKRADEFR